MVVLRGATLGIEDLITFAVSFGELVPSWDPFSERADPAPLVQVVEAADSPARKEPGDSTSRHWHTDVSFARRPSPITVLACDAPAVAGGATEFADLRAALRTLPSSTARQLRRLEGIHSFAWRIGSSLRAKHDAEVVDRLTASYPDVRHPLVVVDRGHEALFVSQLCLREVMGIPIGESSRLLEDLLAHATQADNVYSHQWAAGDVLVWNNRAVMHRRSLGPVVGTRRLLRLSTGGVTLRAGAPPT
jgi:taurine dioxygenase